MKNTLMIAMAGLLLLAPGISFAGHDTTLVSLGTSDSNDTTTAEVPFSIQEEMAEFPGGETALEQYFTNNIHYPAMALNEGIEGTVIVSFLIDENGYVTEMEILRGIGGGCEEEVTRVLRNMPGWKPASQAGHTVKTKKTFSFLFQL